MTCAVSPARARDPASQYLSSPCLLCFFLASSLAPLPRRLSTRCPLHRVGLVFHSPSPLHPFSTQPSSLCAIPPLSLWPYRSSATILFSAMSWTPSLLLITLLLPLLLGLALPSSLADPPPSPSSPSSATDGLAHLPPPPTIAGTDPFAVFADDLSPSTSPSPLLPSDEVGATGALRSPTVGASRVGRSSAPDAAAGVSVSVNNNVEINIDGHRLRPSISSAPSTSSSLTSAPAPDSSEPLFTPEVPPLRLGSSVGVGGASGRRPPPIPLTLVDDSGRSIARGFFKPTEVAQRISLDTGAPLNRLGLGIGGGGRGDDGGSGDQIGTGTMRLDRLTSTQPGGVHSGHHQRARRGGQPRHLRRR